MCSPSIIKFDRPRFPRSDTLSQSGPLNISAVVSIYAVLLPSFLVTFLRKLLSMLSKQQKLLLAQLVRDHKMIVLAPFSSKVTKKAKQEAWETIRTQLNGVGANIDSAKTLRDVLWANIRRSALKKSYRIKEDRFRRKWRAH